ncbi:MAG: DNA/RNA non-specific endonuclease [Ruegeria sp.]
MTDRAFTESLNRLEGLRANWDFDKLKQVIDDGPPILKELGLADAAATKQMLDSEPGQLEAAGHSPVQLEAIVRAVGRPPLLVRNGQVEGKTQLGADFAQGTDIKITNIEPLIPSVGRIEFRNHDMSWGGTGWVIDEEDDGSLLVITNRHVAKLVARRTFLGDGVFMFGPGNIQYGAAIDFLEEVETSEDDSRTVRIQKFTYIADDISADVALARIDKPGDGLAVTPLPRAEADAENGEMIAVIGYPASDGSRNDRTQMERYFQGLYDVKRFAPGFVQVADDASRLGHDATTLGGNSGSPVISLDSGKVVGLHFAGRFGIGNSAVRVSTLTGLLDDGAAGDVHPSAGGPTEAPEGHEADHFAGREGYDAEFLQVVPVPLPKLSDRIPLTAPSDATPERPFELRYQHFSVLYGGAVKGPLLTALNVDGEQTKRVKRGSTRWRKDLRIPAEQQLDKEAYGHADIDRGHLVRRAITNWGETHEIAKRANKDTFHYTVASPQHQGFNQNHQTWLGLEDYIMDNVRTHGFRANVFTGPIFTGHEPPLGDTGAPVPLEYFKLVTMLAEAPEEDGILRLHATAYVLSQGQLIHGMLSDRGHVEAVEGFAFGEYKTFQVRISDLEAATGHDFGQLRDFDPLARADGTEAGEALAVTIWDLENIRL